MKFNEFENDALKKHYKKKGFSEEQIDEIIPAIAAVGARAAGSIAARGGAALAKGAARAAGSIAARGGAALAKGAARAASKSIGGRSRNNQSNDTDQDNKTTSSSTTGTQPTRPTQPTQPSAASNNSDIKKKLRPGQTIKMPAGKTGKPTDFKVASQQGKDVRIKNPRPLPGEPKEFVFNKDELAQALKDME